MKKLLLLSCLSLSTLALPVLASPININTADAKGIADALAGVGLKKAEAIVQYRTEHGPFKTIEELGNVTGMGEKTIEKNKVDILLGDAAAVPPKPVTKASK